MLVFGHFWSTSENFTSVGKKFINTYIDRQLGQMKESIGDVEVSERAIINLFYEILGEEK